MAVKSNSYKTKLVRLGNLLGERLYLGYKLVWQYIKGYIYTKDGKAVKTKDGLFIKCKDQL